MECGSLYYPYFRGKQYELITIRESVEILKSSGFIPIIEPVRESLDGLKKTLDILEEHEAQSIVVINPQYGDHCSDANNIRSFIEGELSTHKHVSVGIVLTESITVDEVLDICTKNNAHSISFIHNGFQDIKSLVEKMGDGINEICHIFFEERCGKLYRRHVKDSKSKILLRDGFQRRVNRAHPELEFFSDLHITYEEEAMNGFGDFLIVGDDYSESGGPAYTVAIHLTFIDQDQDGAMFVHHFLSDTQNTPKNPAGKFAEALAKLAAEVNKSDSKIYKSSAVRDFLELHERAHFPGLGYVKKLSMKHHIETLAHYFEKQ